MKSLQDKYVLVVGLGLHGGAIGTIEWLKTQGAHISVSDTKTEKQLSNSIEKLRHISNITYYFGNQDELDLSHVDMIIRNPGVPRTAKVLQRATELHIPIEMDSGLFFKYSSNQNIIGITGSKGKTTTSNAIFHVLKNIIPKTIAVGIDGIAPLTPALSQNGRGHTATPIVFELSSWRLEALQEKQLSPHIAVCTSIYKDHLNTYASYEEYIDTKKQIIRDQKKHDIAILNYDDKIIRTWEHDVKGELYWYSLKSLPENNMGIWVEDEKIFCNVIPAHTGIQATWMPDQVGHDNAGKVPIEICSVSQIPHRTPHELRNILPSILVGLLNGGTIEQIIHALQTMPALKHRMQLVREINGVQYINDTTATMPDALIAGLESLQDKPLILILGGSDKNLEFDNLAQTISKQKNIKHLIWLPGTATQSMQKEVMPHASGESHDADTMQLAVALAHSIAEAGDTVLLSPGATSFGLFLHEFDRGDAFIKAVENL